MRRPSRKQPKSEGGVSSATNLLVERARAHAVALEEERQSQAEAVSRFVPPEPACPVHPEWGGPSGPGHFQPQALRSLCPFCAAELREKDRRAREARPEVEIA